MPLSILAILVVFGVCLIVGIAHLLSGMTSRTFETEQAVKKRFAIDFPGFEPVDVVLSTDHKSALLFSDRKSEAGLVISIGAHSLTRLLSSQAIRSLNNDDGKIMLGLNDMTLPLAEIVLEDKMLTDNSMMKLATISGATT